jgi:hypothetical protein
LCKGWAAAAGSEFQSFRRRIRTCVFPSFRLGWLAVAKRHVSFLL